MDNELENNRRLLHGGPWDGRFTNLKGTTVFFDEYKDGIFVARHCYDDHIEDGELMYNGLIMKEDHE